MMKEDGKTSLLKTETIMFKKNCQWQTSSFLNQQNKNCYKCKSILLNLTHYYVDQCYYNTLKQAIYLV